MTPAVIRHLQELRTRLLWAFAFLGVAMLGIYIFKEALLDILIIPLTRGELAPEDIVISSVTELFFVYLRITTWGGLFLTMPVLLFQIWRFIGPGLYSYEKRWVAPLLMAMPVLFYTGGLFSYFVVLPLALNFFLGFSQPGLTLLPNVSDYLKMLFNFGFAFGLAFNMPVLLVLMIKIGITSVAKLRAWRRFAIILIFIFSAIVTPPDPFSQLFLALPLIVLYELAIIAAVWMGSKTSTKSSDS